LGKSLDSGSFGVEKRRNDEIISHFQAFLPPENPFSSPCQGGEKPFPALLNNPVQHKKHAHIRIPLTDLTAFGQLVRSFQFQDTDPYNPDLLSTRSILGRVTLYF